VKLGKSATKTPEMLHEAFGEHSLSWTVVFKRHSSFKVSRVSAEDDERSGRPSTNNRKCCKNSRTHPRGPLPNNPWAHRHHWDQLWSLPGVLSRLFEHAPHFREVCFPTLDKWSKCVLSYERRLTGTQLLRVSLGS
jgi:hypothetical protein